MRISDWSSDVCSSDLCDRFEAAADQRCEAILIKAATLGDIGIDGLDDAAPALDEGLLEPGLLLGGHGAERRAPEPPQMLFGAGRRQPLLLGLGDLLDRKSFGEGKRVLVRVDFGGLSIHNRIK